MQVSKQDLDPKVARELQLGLSQLFADIRTQSEANLLMEELFSETERVAIMKRLGIALLLSRGMSYEKIRQTLKVSSATIATIQERMGRPGLQLALDTIKVNIIAEAWLSKVSKLFSVFR